MCSIQYLWPCCVQRPPRDDVSRSGISKRLAELQAQAAAQIDQLKTGHTKEMARLQRTLEDKCQLELVLKESSMKAQLDVEVGRRVAIEVAKAKNDFDVTQRATNHMLDEANRRMCVCCLFACDFKLET